MSSEIKILTKDDLVKKVLLLNQFEMRYPGWLKIVSTRIVNEKILDILHTRMEDLGYSRKIIERTFIDNLQLDAQGEMSFDLVSDYQSDSGFDVSKAREEGTRDHGPTHANALSWISQGVRIFRKWVHGITKSNVIERTIEEFTPVAQDRLDTETDDLLSKILKT